MPPIPRVSATEIVRGSLRDGEEIHPVRGSHHVLKAADRRPVPAPVRADEGRPVGTIGGIIEDAGFGFTVPSAHDREEPDRYGGRVQASPGCRTRGDSIGDALAILGRR